MQLTSPRASILHLHSSFLPKTELWIPRLLSEVCAYSHMASAGRVCVDGVKDIPHIQFHRHRLGHVVDQRFGRHQFLRGIAKARLALVGGEATAVHWTLKKAKLSPSLLHAHFGDVGCTYLPLAKRLKLPYIVSFYGWDYLKLPRQQPEFKRHYKRLFSSVSALVAEGPAAAESLVSLGAPREKVHVINLGTVLPQSDTLRPVSSSDLFIQVASLTEKKGQLITIRAFEKIATRFPKSRLLLVGNVRSITYANQVFRAINTSQFSSRIELRDFVEMDKLGELFSVANAFVQPSLTASDGDSEGGAPVALLDAQAYGLPAIVSDHCDLPFVTAPLGWNEPVRQGNTDELSSAMAAALQRDVENTLTDRIKVLRFIERKFSIQKWGQKLEELYDQYCDR